MAREFAKAFYHSQAWKNCRKSFLKSKHNLCEECLKQGRITKADTVHHKVHLSPENINNPNITLSFNNLEALCRDCHAEKHASEKRYKITDNGEVIIK